MAIAGVRRRHVEEEGESVFVSMTDLTVSFLFVILILLAFFATQFKPEETVSRVEHDALEAELSEARDKIRGLEEALAAARRKIEGLEEERRDLDARLSERGRTISVLRGKLAKADEMVRALSTRVGQLEGDLEHMRVERDDARERIKSLMDEVDRFSVAVADLQREVRWLQVRIAELEKPDPLAAYLEEVSSARSTLLERLAERIRRQLPGIRVTVVAADRKSVV